MLKPWAKASALPGGHVRRDVLVVDRLLLRVRREDHHDIGGRRRLGDRQHLEPLLFRFGDRGRALAQPDDHVDTGVTQVEGVAVTLRPVADHRDGLAVDDRRVGVVGVIDVRGHALMPFWSSRPRESGRAGSRSSFWARSFSISRTSAPRYVPVTPAGPSPREGAVDDRAWAGRHGRCAAAPPSRTWRAAPRSHRACPGCPRG